MTQYKLTYFDNRGLAEPIRLILVYAGTNFEDVRIPQGGLTPEKRKELDLEWGQLPILEFNGEKKAQSWAIARYLAKKFNLAGKTEAEQFRCEEIVEAVRDYLTKGLPMVVAIRKDDPEQAKSLKKAFIEVESPVFLKRFNDILEKQRSTYLVGNSLTYADLYVVHIVTNFNKFIEVSLDKDFPALTKLIVAVENDPKLKQWYETRPVTQF